MFDILDDTIAAISSAPGFGPRGIVRVSGPEAIAIAAALFSDNDSTPLPQRKGFRRFYGEVRIEHDATLPADLYLFRAPRSYTRQDLVEFHTLGSPPVLAMLLERALERGARPAEPGEFTARAFFNGAMSLSQAEAVSTLIRARSDAQLRAAHRLREQAPARQVEAWMEKLAELVALVEADIDFAEERIDFTTPAELRDRLTALRVELDALAREADRAERFDVLPSILLIGPANAGKSSLMNVLSGTDRAICSAVEGTTRDLLTAPITLPGVDCLLLDGAGLTQTDDELLQLAQAMTRGTARQVELLCLVLDISTPPPDDALEILRHHRGRPAVIAANKSDLVDTAELSAHQAALRRAGLGPVVATSTVTGAGLAELKFAMRAQLGDDAGGGEEHTVLLSARQRQAVAFASAALNRAIAQTREIGQTLDRADLIAFELREALDALGTICGEVTTEDLLGRVFANFCVGK
ncbi:MAG: tRNA uridine-5-carboxymethylaminomethyl(34) synthesis GTPase MnmE [Planctomycetota bacterium]